MNKAPLDPLRMLGDVVFADNNVMSKHIFDFNRGECFDWRNYVPHSVRQVWGQLSEESRLAVMITCDTIARREDRS